MSKRKDDSIAQSTSRKKSKKSNSSMVERIDVDDPKYLNFKDTGHRYNKNTILVALADCGVTVDDNIRSLSKKALEGRLKSAINQHHAMKTARVAAAQTCCQGSSVAGSSESMSISTERRSTPAEDKSFREDKDHLVGRTSGNSAVQPARTNEVGMSSPSLRRGTPEHVIEYSQRYQAIGAASVVSHSDYTFEPMTYKNVYTHFDKLRIHLRGLSTRQAEFIQVGRVINEGLELLKRGIQGDTDIPPPLDLMWQITQSVDNLMEKKKNGDTSSSGKK